MFVTSRWNLEMFVAFSAQILGEINNVDIFIWRLHVGLVIRLEKCCMIPQVNASGESELDGWIQL